MKKFFCLSILILYINLKILAQCSLTFNGNPAAHYSWCDNEIFFQINNSSGASQNLLLQIDLPADLVLSGTGTLTGCIGNYQPVAAPGGCNTQSVYYLLQNIPNGPCNFSYDLDLNCNVPQFPNNPSYNINYSVYTSANCATTCSQAVQTVNFGLPSINSSFPGATGSNINVTNTGALDIEFLIVNNTLHDLTQPLNIIVCSPISNMTLTSYQFNDGDCINPGTGCNSNFTTITGTPCGATLTGYVIPLNYSNLDNCLGSWSNSSSFEGLQELCVKLTFNISSCWTNTVPVLHVFTSWNCDGTGYCHLDDNFVQLTPMFNNPEIVVDYGDATNFVDDGSSNMLFDYCYGEGNSTIMRMPINNDGGADASDVHVTFNKSNLLGFTFYDEGSFIIQTNDIPPAIWPAGLQWSTSSTAVHLPCQTGNYYENFTITIPSMLANTVYYLFWKAKTCCPPFNQDPNPAPAKDNWQVSADFTRCDNSIVHFPQSGYFNIPLNLTNGIFGIQYDGPNDLYGYGGSYTYTPDPNCNTPISYGMNSETLCFDLEASPSIWQINEDEAEVTFRITIPDEVMTYVPSSGSGIGNVSIYFPFVPYTLTNPTIAESWNNCDHILEITIDNSTAQQLLTMTNNRFKFLDNARVCFDIWAYCPIAASAFADLDLILNPSTDCIQSCLFGLGSKHQPLAMHCPGCPRQGIHPQSFVMHRVTYGYADDNNNGLWDATCGGNYQPTQLTHANVLTNHQAVKTKRAMVGDIMEGVLEANIQINNDYGPWPFPHTCTPQFDYPGFPNAYWELTLADPSDLNRLTALGAIVEVTTPLGVESITIPPGDVKKYFAPGVSSTIGTPCGFIYNFSMDVFHAQNKLLQYDFFEDGWTLHITNQLRIIRNVPGEDDIVFTNVVYLGLHDQRPFDMSGVPQLFDPDGEITVCGSTAGGAANCPDLNKDNDCVTAYCCEYSSQYGTCTNSPYGTYTNCPADDWKWFCDKVTGSFKQYGYSLSLLGSLDNADQDISNKCGVWGMSTYMNSVQFGYQQCYANPFPFEYRNWLAPSRLDVILPQGFHHLGGQIAPNYDWTWLWNYTTDGQTNSHCNEYIGVFHNKPVVNEPLVQWDFLNGTPPGTISDHYLSDGSECQWLPNGTYPSLHLADDDFLHSLKNTFLAECDAPEEGVFEIDLFPDYVQMGGTYGLNFDANSVPTNAHRTKKIIYPIAKRPVLQVTTQVQPGCGDEAVWVVDIMNIGNDCALHAFFSPHPNPGDGVHITQLKVNGVIKPIPADHAIADLGFLAAGGLIQLEIHGTYNCNAAIDQLHMVVGWNSTLPGNTIDDFTSTHANTCFTEFDLMVDPDGMQLSTEVTATSANICTPFDVTLEILNAGCNTFDNMNFQLTLPANANIFTMTSTTAYITYDGIINQPITFIPSGTTYSVDLSNLAPPVFLSGLPGYLINNDFDESHFQITFTVQPGCEISYDPADYIQLEFTATSSSSCPANIIYNQSFNPLLSSCNSGLNYLLIGATPSAFDNTTCITGTNDIGTEVSFNLSFNSACTTTGNFNDFIVDIPVGFTLVSNSINPSAYGQPIGNTVKWDIPFGLTSFPLFSFRVIPDPATGCGDYDFDARVESNYDIPCITYSCTGIALQDEKTFTIHYKAPDSQFSFTPVSPVCENTDISFTCNSTCGHFSWDFDDGGSSTDPCPVTYQYATAGNFEPCLKITAVANAACKNPVCVPIEIITCLPCGVDMSFTAVPGLCSNQMIQFTNTSHPHAGTVISWVSWNFGDNTANSILPNPIHYYNFPGTYTVCLTIHSTNNGNNCPPITYCTDITVLPDLCDITADFTYISDPTDCRIVQFTDVSSFSTSGCAIAWLWNFGDNTTSTLQNPVHTYLGPCPTNVTLTVTGQAGALTCTDQVILLVEGCACGVHADYTYGINGCQATFDATAEVCWPPAEGYFWEIDGLLVSQIEDPILNFTAQGIHTVCLGVVAHDPGAGGAICTTMVCHDITIEECCKGPCTGTASFGIISQSACKIKLQDLSSPQLNIIGWLWTFGDGTVSNAQNPNHTYYTDGTYKICLTVTFSINGELCYDTYCKTVEIKSCGQSEVLCEVHADFKILLNGCKVAFDDKSFSAFNTTITGWYWTFGDGTSSNAQNPVHTYTVPGSYLVCLTVNGFNGVDHCTNTYCLTVQIPETCIKAECSLSPMFFSFSNGCTGFFNDLSISGNNTTILSWHWDFGDGGTSSYSNPTHNYNAPGSYMVCLTITGSDGVNSCTERYCQCIKIDGCQPVPCDIQSNWMFVSNHDYPCVISFFDMSIPGSSSFITGWQWDFGDGTTSIDQNPIHIYGSPGLYMVCLISTATDGNIKCDDQYCFEINVGACSLHLPCRVRAEFSWTGPNDDCNIYFINQSSSPNNSMITGYYWDFGDGTTSTDVHPTHFYSQSGVYTVYLTVYGLRAGVPCESTISHDVTMSDCGPDARQQATTLPHGCIIAQLLRPNPASNQTWLNIESNCDMPADAELLNGIGQTMQRHKLKIVKGSNSFELNVGDLPKGIYIVRISGQYEVKTLKLVIN